MFVRVEQSTISKVTAIISNVLVKRLLLKEVHNLVGLTAYTDEEGGWLEVSAENDGFAIEVTIACEVVRPGFVVVSLERFGVLGGATEIELNEGRLSVVLGDADNCDFIYLPTVDKESQASLHLFPALTDAGAVLPIEALQGIASAKVASNSNPKQDASSLGCVHLWIEEDKVKVAAADGHRMAYFMYLLSEDVGEHEASYSIPLSACKVISDLSKYAEPAWFSVNYTAAKSVLGRVAYNAEDIGYAFKFRLSGVNPPYLPKLAAPDWIHAYQVSTKDLLVKTRHINAYGRAKSDIFGTEIELSFAGEHSIRMNAHLPGIEVYKEVECLQARKPATSLSILTSGNYLADGLDFIQAETCWILIDAGKRNYAIVRDIENFHHVLHLVMVRSRKV
jgi:DNA polymerase III sliding clamp (beta) subunit (PCNA family)